MEEETQTTSTATPATKRENTMKKPAMIAVVAGLVIIGGLYGSKYLLNGGDSFFYKDGTYSATGKYLSPGGDEEVGVELTIADNKITATNFTPKADKPASVKFQAMFNEGYKEMVVGKDVNDIELDKVSGSSLTPKGFMDALKQVKSQAQVF